jgi:hypothetical protein
MCMWLWESLKAEVDSRSGDVFELHDRLSPEDLAESIGRLSNRPGVTADRTVTVSSLPPDTHCVLML